MDKLRVFLVWKHPLLHDMVAAILRQVEVTMVGESFGNQVLETMQSLKPDVILVEEEEGLLEQVLPYLTTLNSGRLVCINLADNKLNIYHREERMLNQTADLIAALEQKPAGSG